MMIWLFLFLAFLCFVGIIVGLAYRNGHQMAYSALMLVVWLAAAAWWAGWF